MNKVTQNDYNNSGYTQFFVEQTDYILALLEEEVALDKAVSDYKNMLVKEVIDTTGQNIDVLVDNDLNIKRLFGAVISSVRLADMSNFYTKENNLQNMCDEAYELSSNTVNNDDDTLQQKIDSLLDLISNRLDINDVKKSFVKSLKEWLEENGKELV